MAVARGAGVSHTTVGRIERASLPGVSIDILGRICAAVGLDLVVRAYPNADPIRDQAQVALLERLRQRLPPTCRWNAEVPLARPGDLRAWDAVVRTADGPTAIEAETRLADVQAMQRRIGLKQRDGGMSRVVILIAATDANRRALAASRAALRTDYPLDTREVIAALIDGRQPPANGIVVL